MKIILCILVFLAIVKCMSCINILLPIDETILEEKILHDIISQTVNLQDKILYASNGIDINYLLKKYSSLYYNYKIKYYEDFNLRFANYKPIDIYILSLTSINLLDKLMELDEWNSRAKFIIYYQSNHELNKNNLFKYLTENYIYNVVIVSANEVYGNDPYKYENFNEPNINPYLITSNQYFPNKLPKTWSNSTLIAMGSCMPPFAVDFQRKYLTGGSEFRLLNEIMGPGLKVKLDYKYDFQGAGTRIINGTYTLLLGRLRNREAILGFGVIYLAYPYIVLDFDISHPYGQEINVWAVPSPLILSHGANLIRICTPQMWMAFLLTMIIASICWLFCGIFVQSEHPHYKNNWETFMMPSKFLLSELASYNPQSLPMKYLYIGTWIFICIINAAWEAYLIMTLTYNHRDKPIKTMADVIERNLHISVPKMPAFHYMQSGSPYGKEVYERNNPVETLPELQVVLDRVADQRDMMGLTTMGIIEHIISMGFWNDGGVPALTRLDDAVYLYSISQAIVKGHPIFPRYNEMMNWVRASGMSKMYLADIKHNNRLRQVKTPELEQVQVLTVEQLMSTFVILTIGCSIATFVFIIEIYYKKDDENFI